MNFVFAMAASYLIGSIPFAYLFTKFIVGKDVRDIGSGNVGATNAARVMGFKYGLLVAILDVVKGVAAVAVVRLILSSVAPGYLLIASLMAIFGHNWSIFLKFSGGKGVATTLGVLLNIMPFVFLLAAAIWIVMVLLTRIVSISSIVSAIAAPVLAYFINGNVYYILFTAILAFLIIVRHSSNIKRLINGDERRMNWPPNKKRGNS